MSQCMYKHKKGITEIDQDFSIPNIYVNIHTTTQCFTKDLILKGKNGEIAYFFFFFGGGGL